MFTEEGRYCFHRCLSVHISGTGGTPIWPMGWYPHLANRAWGTPIWSMGRGIPSSQQGGTPIWIMGVSCGTPLLGLDGVTPLGLIGGTTSLVRTDWWYHPPGQDWMGYLPVGTGWGHPPLGDRESEQLRGGRYASCLHAEGLSCFRISFFSENSPADQATKIT